MVQKIWNGGIVPKPHVCRAGSLRLGLTGTIGEDRGYPLALEMSCVEMSGDEGGAML